MGTRRIGLSLGADICWPICFEQILRRLDLKIKHDGETVDFDVERVRIRPFNLREPVDYDVVVDRLTHWYSHSREWIKKAIVLDDVYFFNNPWSLQSMEKQTTYCAMMRLGMPIPETWLVPPRAYEPSDDLEPTLRQYANMFDLDSIGREIGYPLFLKPYSGGGWVGVTRASNGEELKAAYDDSGTLVMNMQASVEPHDAFVRCVGLGPQVRIVNYAADAPLHDRYQMDTNFLPAEDQSLLADTLLTINSFFGWDFNSAEILRGNGVWQPIDFANACPDSQVTSLHYHFPWLVKANLRWSLFNATLQRRMHHPLSWEPFLAIADEPDLDHREQLRRYAAIAHQRFETERFEEFCATHLAHLDEVADEFFGSEGAHDAVRKKVTAIFPANEIEEFTELFWSRIQDWRKREGSQPLAVTGLTT